MKILLIILGLTIASPTFAKDPKIDKKPVKTTSQTKGLTALMFLCPICIVPAVINEASKENVEPSPAPHPTPVINRSLASEKPLKAK